MTQKERVLQALQQGKVLTDYNGIEIGVGAVRSRVSELIAEGQQIKKAGDDIFYNVFYWMMSKLKLSGNECHVFALIYSFSRNGKYYYESQKRTAEILLLSKPTVNKCLKELQKKNYITQEYITVNGSKKCAYVVNFDVVNRPNNSKEILPIRLKNFTDDSKEILPIRLKNFTESGKKTLLNNIIQDNTVHIREGNIYTPPTLAEIEQYANDNGYIVNVRKFYHHYNSIGWMVGNTPMQDWRSTLARWNDEDKEKNKSTDTAIDRTYDLDEIERKAMYDDGEI